MLCFQILIIEDNFFGFAMDEIDQNDLLTLKL